MREDQSGVAREIRGWKRAAPPRGAVSWKSYYYWATAEEYSKRKETHYLSVGLKVKTGAQLSQINVNDNVSIGNDVIVLFGLSHVQQI